MRGGAFLKRWLDVLAAMLMASREAWRSRNSLVISRRDGRFSVRRLQSGRPVDVGSFGFGHPAPAEIVAAARRSLVVFELPPDQLVVRRITVPAQAREFLPGIVRNQIERLSPWQPEHAIYGFDAKPSPDDPAVLDVPVSITSRATVERACDELAAAGIVVDRIVPEDREASATVAPLWSRLADASRQSLDRARWTIAAATAALVVVCASLSVWALLSAGSIRDENDVVAEKARVVQRQLQPSRTAQSLAALSPAERAWVSKETSPSAVIALEVLSRALPDSAYLSEMQLEKTTLRLIGLTQDAPALIAPLEHSGLLTEVHFFAPTTRGSGADAALFRFNIEARLKPQLDLAEVAR